MLLLGAVLPSAAQDVEVLGRMHGVRPPEAYYELRRSDPSAFEFRRVWRNRTGLRFGAGGAGASPGARAPGAGGGTAAATGLGPRDAPVAGTFDFPVLLGLFSDSPADPPFDRDEIQREYFDGPSSRLGTIPEYYDEVSRGRVTLRGETFVWRRSGLSRETVTGSSSGLGRDAEVGEFIVELLQGIDGSGVDWSRFDNDGPDGVPDSGDDDGFVDVLAVVHPTEGAECGGAGSDTKIWSHRWRLSAALDDPGGEPFTTSTTSADGDPIRVDDYVIVPSRECGSDRINPIGVLTHELGHGFGLPDLYGTGITFVAGAGNWGLMGTGNWGCDARAQNPARPCHPGAWTKSVLGWVDVDTIPPDAAPRTVSLDPVEAGGRVLRVESNDASGEYFLLEHRAQRGFDRDLPVEGLLVWQVDPARVAERWRQNRVNSDPRRPGVWLRQADGLGELMSATGDRGDAGDPFPGSVDLREFHAGTEPAPFTHLAEPSGLTLTDIRTGASLGLELSNRYHTVSLGATGADGDHVLFTVDGTDAPAGTSHAFDSAPFQAHVIEAAPGEPISDGVRRGFQGWADGSPRVRDFRTRSDTALVASYGGRELEFAVELSAAGDTVTPGRVDLVPGTEDGWVPEGATVRVEAVPRTGFVFAAWSGAFSGRSNPFMIDAVQPLDAGARFEVTYSVAGNPAGVSLVAAETRSVLLETTNGNDPVSWELVDGRLPPGVRLRPGGSIVGAPLEEGSFPVRVRALDAIGLRAELGLEVTVEPPAVGVRTLAAPFLQDDDGPTARQREYMDWIGNRNESYDVGDLRAFLRKHPEAPATARPSAQPEAVSMPAIRLRPPEEPDGTAGGGGR